MDLIAIKSFVSSDVTAIPGQVFCCPGDRASTLIRIGVAQEFKAKKKTKKKEKNEDK